MSAGASVEPATARPMRVRLLTCCVIAVVLAVASMVPSSAVNLPSMKAMLRPSCVTWASTTSGPGFAGARKFTVRLMVVV